MSIKYGEPLLFKPQNVCKRSGRIKVLSMTNKVEDGLESPMLHTKFRENRPAGSGEEDF